jgi:hypothetical protein
MTRPYSTVVITCAWCDQDAETPERGKQTSRFCSRCMPRTRSQG